MDFFTPVDGDNYYATCNMYKKRLSYKTINLNLRKHITSNHPSVSLTSSNPGKTDKTKNPMSCSYIFILSLIFISNQVTAVIQISV